MMFGFDGLKPADPAAVIKLIKRSKEVPSENEPKTVLLLVEIPHQRSPDGDIRIGGDDPRIPDGAIRATFDSDCKTAMQHLTEKDWGVTTDSRALLHHLMIPNQMNEVSPNRMSRPIPGCCVRS